MSTGNTSRLSFSEQYELIGKVAVLVADSSMHRHFSMTEFLRIILPPVHLNQFRLYENEQKEAVGFVAWAFFSKEVEKKYLSGKAVLSYDEWNSGEKLYITDLITKENGIAKKIVDDMKHHVFADKVAHALRFDKPGQHRGHISLFYGANVPKTQASRPQLGS